MRFPIAIVIAGALIAAAILLGFRWEISGTAAGVFWLDRWTGHLKSCNLSACYDVR